MQAIKITPETLPAIHRHLELACNSGKDQEVLIRSHNNSLKARQRRLAQCWYKDIAEGMDVTVSGAEAFCKYHYGLRLICGEDQDLEKIIRRMLDGYNYEQKLKIIEIYPEWFPILRDKGGLTSDLTGLYLSTIQQKMGEQGIFLTTPNEMQLLDYPEAKK